MHLSGLHASSSASGAHIGALVGDRYRLLTVLGRGQSGTVYSALELADGAEVAVKLLHPDLARDAGMLRRFEREAEAMARVAHPNIVAVHGVCAGPDGAPALVMEHVRGRSLEDLLSERGPLPPGEAVMIARQISAGLAAVHAAGIVHRDLKPANIALLPLAGDALLVKILDFGVAKIVAGARTMRLGEAALTAHGAICGTPHYLAPEQARGAVVDARADLYGLGIILYRMLTGRVPFDGAAMAVVLQHLSVEPVSPAVHEPALPPELVEVTMRCLAKEPDERFQSAAALERALSAVAGAAARPSQLARAATVPATDGRHEVAGPEAYAATRALASVELEPAIAPVRRRSRAGRVATVGLALAAAAVLALLGASRFGTLAPASSAATAGAASPATTVPVRALMVSEEGYSARVTVPERAMPGVEYDLVVELWDADGEPIDAPQLVITIEAPDGSARSEAAVRTRPGTFALRRSFAHAGGYTLRLFPPTGDGRLRVALHIGGEMLS